MWKRDSWRKQEKAGVVTCVVEKRKIEKLVT